MQSRRSTFRFAITLVFANLMLPSRIALGTISEKLRDYAAPLPSGENDTPFLQSMIDTVSETGGGRIFIPAGIYRIVDLRLRSNVSLIGISRLQTKFLEPTGNYYLLSVNPGSLGTSDPIANVRNVTLRNISFEGSVDRLGFSEHKHLLNFNAISDLVIDNCIIRGFRGDGIYLGSGNEPNLTRHNQRVTIRSCIFDGVTGDNRNAITVIDGTDIVIAENTFVNCSRPDMPGPIDIEPNRSVFTEVSRISIRNNIFRECGGRSKIQAWFGIYPSLSRNFSSFEIINNTIAPNQRSGYYGIYIHIFFRTSPSSKTSFGPTNWTINQNKLLWGENWISGVSFFEIKANIFEGPVPLINIGVHQSKADAPTTNGIIRRNTFRVSHKFQEPMIIDNVVNVLASENLFVVSDDLAHAPK